jgi:hypothetical protein
MEDRYHTKYKAEEIDKLLENASAAVMYKPQTLTPEEQAQARENIGVTGYYSTKREEIGVSHEKINSAYIWGLYDDLMEEYPDNVQKNEIHNDDGSFTNCEYVISTGEYRTDGAFAQNFGADTNTKKPKYLIMNAVDGQERKTAFSTYRFIRDVLAGHNVPNFFKEGAIVKVIPVSNPSGFDAFTKWNDNAVAINRNFDWQWKSGTGDYDLDGVKDYTFGASAASEKETQVIAKWLEDNSDADLFIDYHNSSYVNEQVIVIGLRDNDASNLAQKVAMRGLDHIIPFWRDGFSFSALDTPALDADGNVVPSEPKEIIFSNSVSGVIHGSAFCYANEVCKIPSIAIETATYYGNYSEWKAGLDEGRYDDVAYHPESIAMGAEAIGNILLEFYAQAFFGEVSEDMKEIDNKLETLEELMNSVVKGFRTESGVIVLDEDVLPKSGSIFQYRIPCSNGAKLVDFHADDNTFAAIKAKATANQPNGTRYSASLLANCCAPKVMNHSGITKSLIMSIRNQGYQGSAYAGIDMIDTDSTTVDNTDGLKFNCRALMAGTYHWTAYYWND